MGKFSLLLKKDLFFVVFLGFLFTGGFGAAYVKNKHENALNAPVAMQYSSPETSVVSQCVNDEVLFVGCGGFF